MAGKNNIHHGGKRLPRIQHIKGGGVYGDGSFNLIESRCSGGGYAGDGASLADELDFTANNLADSSKGSSSAQVTIHELVHQWWGLGNMFDPMDENGIWSAEGLTCYTTYRIVKALYGEREAQTSFVDTWQEAADDYYKDFYVRHRVHSLHDGLMLTAVIEINSNACRFHRNFLPDIIPANGAKGGSSAQVTIHEIVHQWWGLGNMFDPMDENGIWSAEGLTEPSPNKMGVICPGRVMSVTLGR